MVDFLGQNLSIIQYKDLLKSIKNYCLSNYPYESGGLIFANGVTKEYKSKIKDCHNYLPIDDFYIDIVKNQNVVASFHSHLNSLTPSGNDLFFMKNYDIPIIIYSLNKNTFLSVNIKDETNLITWNFEEACLPEI